jgi:hypothetical protein
MRIVRMGEGGRGFAREAQKRQARQSGLRAKNPHHQKKILFGTQNKAFREKQNAAGLEAEDICTD